MIKSSVETEVLKHFISYVPVEILSVMSNFYTLTFMDGISKDMMIKGQ